MMINDFELLKKAVQEAHQKFSTLQEGSNASYIPELLNANPEDFAISITSVDGQTFSIGNSQRQFTMQSASKPFVYGLALEQVGREAIMKKVGVEPSGEAFNSIIKLEADTHLPFNPMINSGAIAVTHQLQEDGEISRLERLKKHFSALCGHSIQMSEAVYQSEKKTAHRNQAIASLLRHFNVVNDQIDESLNLYFQQCSLLANSEELSAMAATLANQGIQPITEQKVYSPQTVRDILSVMFTCGMYDTSGRWAYSVGIPSKSGVSGVIFGVVPNQYGIAVYSPRINQEGHSLRGMRTFEYLSQKLKLHIFESSLKG